MSTHSALRFARLARLLAALILTATTIGVAPQSAPALAAPPAAPAGKPAQGLLPSPVPTILVATTAIANNPSDGQCDLWEALQAVFQANFDLSPTYHECTAVANQPNVIGFVGAAAGGTIEVPATVNNGDLPFVWGDTTLLGPVTIKPSAALTDTHLFRTAAEASFTLIAVTLTGAHSSGSGAAILDLNYATINLIGSNIVGNTADNTGGAIDSNGIVNVSLTNFSGNEALGVNGGAGYGGAIWIAGAGSLDISKSNFAGNIAKAGGGAVYSTIANATIEDSLFSGNIAGQDNSLLKGGGAIYNDVGGALGVARTQFAGNLTPQGDGGAIWNNSGASLVFSDTTFALNLAGDLTHVQYGGAIYDQGDLTVQRSSFVNNISPDGHGGALAVDRHGVANVANTTFALNGAPNGLGAAVIVTQTQAGGPASTFTARNITMSKNGTPTKQDTALYNALGNTANLGNTIIADNINADCAGAGSFVSLGHNLASDNSCNLTGPGDLPNNSNADLGTPSFNGGPLSSMLTMAPANSVLPGSRSAAIDAGDDAICAAAPVNNEDQRGETRPKDGSHLGTNNCDIGAFEADALSPGYGSDPSEPATIDVGSTAINTSVTTTLVISNTGEWPLLVTPLPLVGSDPGDFSVSSVPFTIAPHTPPVNYAITCTPHGSPGSRSVGLGFATTDTPLHAAVGYLLKCNGFNSPVAGYNSAPIAPGPVTFPDSQLYVTKTATVTVFETGDAQLQVTIGGLGGSDPQDFNVSNATFNINDGGAPQAVTINCVPTNYGLRTATLTLNTNDTTAPAVLYNLSCNGVPTLSPDLATGASMGNSPDHGLSGVYGLAISPNGKYVYASAYNAADVSSFQRDTNTGALSYIGKASGPSGDSNGSLLVAISPDGRNLYEAGQTNGDIVTYTVDAATGKMTLPDGIVRADLGGADGVSVSPDGRNVYATGSSSNSVVVFRRDNSTGSLSQVQTVFSNTVIGLGGGHGLTVSPDGQNVYVTGYRNYNSDGTLEVLKRSAIDGTLTHVQLRYQGDCIDYFFCFSGLDGLKGAIQVAVSPDGQNVYVASLYSSAVLAFSRSAADGSLHILSSYFNTTNGVTGLSGASSIAVTPDGKEVIADGYFDKAAVVFDRDPLTGQLTFRQTITRDLGGNPPLNGASDLRISPDGRTVYVAGYLDNAIAVLPFANPVPLLTSVSPASAVQGAPGFTLHVYGASFIPGIQAFFGADHPLTTYINPTQIDVTISAAEIAGAPGVRQVQLQNPDPSAVGGNFSFPVPFHITAPAFNPMPSISSISPQGALAGGITQTLQVYGASFLNTSTVQWNGVSHATTFIDSGHLQVTIPQLEVAQPGAYAVTVVTGVPGGGISNAAQFSVAQPGQNAVPSISAINPPWVYSLGAASKQVKLTITGTGHTFIDGSTVRLDGADRPTKFVNDNQVTATLYGSDLISPASVGISVFTPAPGGGSSNTLTFTIRKLYRLLVPFLRR